MRKNFLLLFLMTLLPLAGWAQQLTLTLSGEGITGNAPNYSATYKGAVYAPGVTVQWDNQTVSQGYTLTYEKLVGNDYEAITASDVRNAGTYKLTAKYTPQGYEEKSASVSFVISTVAITIQAQNREKTYGQPDPEFTINMVGQPVNNETLAYSVARAANIANVTNCGTYNGGIVVTVDDNAAVNKNYTITPQPGNLTINKRQVTITARNKSITYGANVPNSFGYEIDGLVDANGQQLAQDYLLSAHDDINGLLSFAVQYDNNDLDQYSNKLKVKQNGYPISVTVPTAATNYTFQKNDGNLTVNQATMYVKVQDAEITFGENLPAAYALEYVSGFMSQGELNHYVNNGVMVNGFFTNQDTEFSYPGLANAPVNQGEYDVTASGLTADNYKVLVNKGQLTINKQSIANAAVTVDTQDAQQNPYQYTGGGEVKPTVSVTLGGNDFAAENYNVVYKNNTKAYSLTGQESFTKIVQINNQNVEVDKTEEEITFPYVIISAKENGNYSGSIKKAFGIAKAPLTIKADDKTIGLGETPQWSATVTGLLENNKDEIKAALESGQAVEGFTGSLQFSCLGGNNVGEYDIILGGTLAATNYSINLQNGTLTVTKGSLPLKVVVTNNGTYGTDVTVANNLTFAFNEEGEGADKINATVKENVTTLVENVVYTITNDKNQVVNPVNAAWSLPVGTYTVSATAENDDYTTNFATAQLTVEKAKLTITIVNQAVNLYNETVNPVVKNELYGNNGVVNLNAVFYDEDDLAVAHTAYDPTNTPGGYTIKVTGLKNNDQIASLNIDGLAASIETIGQHANAITYHLSDAGANANYDYDTNLTKGQLTINGKAEDANGVTLTLANAATKIAEYDQQTLQHVTVQFDPTVTVTNGNTVLGTSVWKAEKWYTMVLPFETTVADLSKAIGYAIVNVVNAGATTENNIKFQLTMGTLPANQPFMLKTSADITQPVNLAFENVTIVNAAPSVNAGQGYKLVGTYGTKEITGDHADYFLWYHSDKDKTTWDYINKGATAKATISAFNAWADLSPAQNAPEVIFTFEELDGTTTAIKAVDFASGNNSVKNAKGWYTVNGMKLQGAPTEKGVYIKDGKKVVLK